MNKYTFFLLTTLVWHCAQAQTSKLETYTAPNGAELMNEYKVEVSADGTAWQDIPTYAVKVDKGENGRHRAVNVSMAYFDFEGMAKVRVSKLKGDFSSVKVRPLSYNIVPTHHGNVAEFSLTRHGGLSIEFDGDIFNNLHLFANPILKDKPKKKSKNLIYFGHGLHTLAGDTLFVKTGQTVYVDGGAVVKGTISIADVENVKVYGHGIVRPERQAAGISIDRSKHVSVDGVIVTQCPVGGSDDVNITNVKTLTHYSWGDGLNVFASSNVKYDGVFCRTSDDCTTVYATRKGFTGGSHHIEMRNSTLWADVAHPIFIGLHGNVENPDTIEHILYDNIDILDECEFQSDYQGCMAINAGDKNLVRDVTFQNIRIENIRRGQLVAMRVSFNQKYCKAPGNRIENVLFKNISYTGDYPETSIIVGYDEQHLIKNITFENLRINGLCIYDDMPEKPRWYKTSDMARFFVGEHVENITFNK